MNQFGNKKTRALIFIMCALVLSGIAVSYLYYGNINRSTDPRIAEARKLYGKYNIYAQHNDFDSIFWLMDSIELIYSSIEHYKNSYEVGVLYNNRAASLLTKALFDDQLEITNQDVLINQAEIAAARSIGIYQNWLENFQTKSGPEIERIISIDFFNGLENYNTKQTNTYLKNRVKEIQEAQAETKRRLSVSYTNLGIIERHKYQYDDAAKYYKKAMDLWDRNLTAENNLNILLGRPIKKRSFIQKLFPPDRDKN